jgi:hypothetical protein
MNIDVKIERKDSDYIMGVVSIDNMIYPWKLTINDSQKKVILFSLENLDQSNIDMIIEAIIKETNIIKDHEKAYVFLENPYSFEVMNNIDLPEYASLINVLSDKFYHKPFSSLVNLSINSPDFKRALLMSIRKSIFKKIRGKNF